MNPSPPPPTALDPVRETCRGSGPCRQRSRIPVAVECRQRYHHKGHGGRGAARREGQLQVRRLRAVRRRFSPGERGNWIMSVCLSRAKRFAALLAVAAGLFLATVPASAEPKPAKQDGLVAQIVCEFLQRGHLN